MAEHNRNEPDASLVERPAAAPETPAQAALHEPDIYDDQATADLRKQLIERLDSNLSDYFDTLRGKSGKEIAEMSSEIGAKMEAHYYLTEIHNFHTSELNYLLQFRDPLEVVADEFLFAGTDDRSDIMWQIFDRQEALHGDYARIPDITDAESRKQELFDRLDNNMADYHANMMQASKEELFVLAEDIATRYTVREYLKTGYDYKTGEVEALLQYDDPLNYIADRWPGTLDGLVDMSGVMADILEDRSSHGHYAAVVDADTPASKESARRPDAEKPSVIEQLRRAQKEAKDNPAPRKDKLMRDHHGPEL
jgi:hypothetical protein